jgi:hypothetical protein
MLSFFDRLRTKQKQSWKNCCVNPLVLECLEGRITPASGFFDSESGLVWLKYTSTSTAVETVTLTNNGTNITATGNISGTTVFNTSSVKGLRAWTSEIGSAQSLIIAGSTGYSLPSGVQFGYGLDSLTINAAISTETSDFTVGLWKGVVITAPVTTTTGNVTITANSIGLIGPSQYSGVTPPGNYSGVIITSDVITESGNISIVGQGGSDASGQQHGIFIGNSAKVFAGGNGSVSLSGTGGANSGTNNRGIYITGSSIVGTARSGSISINGIGGELSNNGNIGVLINSGSRITPMETGSINISGKGGNSPGTINPGVRIADTNTAIRANGGSISITGSGGSGLTESGKQASDYNVIVEGGAIVSSGAVGRFIRIGNIEADAYDSNNDVLAIDLAMPLFLAAGNYKASSFNRQIAALSSSESLGSITPALVIAQGGQYVPIAVGASSNYSGTNGFASTSFGGSDIFVLSEATTVYAAIHWQAPHYEGGPYRMPVGYFSSSGSSRVFYAEGYGTGAAFPYVGLACAGTSQATFSRSYDFSITIDPASPPSGGSTPPTSGNLIANGDFSLGNTGFGSQYVLTPGNIGGAQTYDVANSWNVLAYGDHTSGTGKMLGVNGSNVANIIFWHQDVALTPNTDYTFSFWTSSWFPGATPLAILIDGTSVGTASVPAGTGQWEQITVAWNSGNRSSAKFSIAATQGFDIGGDFAIDDIALVRANRQPVVASLTNRSDITGNQVSFTAATAFSDPDSDTLTFTATGLPAGLSISSAGLVSGTIASTATVSSPFTTQITASDGQGGSVTGSFTWTVVQPNRNPVAGPLPNLSTGISSVVNLSVASSFSDPDNDALTFSATNLPPGLVLSANGTVTGTVLSSANTTTPYAATVSVNDGRGGTTTTAFSWTITIANRLPVVSPLSDRTDTTGNQVSFAAAQAFSDPDFDTLTFTATGLPTGLSISSAGFISGIIANTAADSSPFTTRISAGDGRGGFVTGSFIWNISAGMSIPHNTAFDLIGLTDLRANPATAGIDGSGIGVAVIDTGIDYAHALFQSGSNPAYYVTSNASGGQVPVGRNFEGDVAPGNFVPGDRRNRFSSSQFNSTDVNQRNADYVSSGEGFDFFPEDTNGHGTHVAGIIGARNPEIGVATGSKLIGLKVLGADGTGSNEHILKALAWVRDNASVYNIKVVNMSLGYGFFQYRGPDDPFLVTISDLESMGITVVSAAGNLYGLTPTERNSSTPGIASTLTVGAVWKDGTVNQAYWPEGDTYDYTTGPGRLASFSQRPADTVDNGIFAPGALMLSAIPNNGLDPTRGNDLTAELAGTSQAAPVVSGVVALMQDAAFRSGGRYLTPAEIRQILFQTATTINDGDNEDDGFARNPSTLQYNLDNNTYADYRMVNANSAVAMVRSIFDTPSQNDDPNGVVTSPVELSPDYARIQIADINPSLDAGNPLRYSPVVADFQGEIGRDGEAVVGDNDVDLYAFTVNMPGALTIRTTRASFSAAVANTQLRLFDSDGNEITDNVDNRDDNDPSTDSNGLFDPFSTLKARLEPGRYFIGVSGQGNAFYNPTSELSGTAGTAVLGVDAKGTYHLTMDYLTQDPNGLLAGAKETFLQVTGAAVQRGFLGGDYLSCSAEIAFPSPDQLDPAYGGTVVDAGALGADGKLSHTISTKVSDVDLFVMTAPENGYISFDIDSLDYTNQNDAGMAADTFVRAWRVEEDGTLAELGSNDNGYNLDERLVDAAGGQANDSRQSTGFDAFLKVSVSAGDRILFGVSDRNNQDYSPLNLNSRLAIANSHVGFYDAFATFTSNDINGRIGSDVYNLDSVGSKAAIGILPTTLNSFSIGYDDQSAIAGPAKVDIGPKDVDFYAYTPSANGTLFVDVDSLEANLPDSVATVIAIFEIVIDTNSFRTLNLVGTSADSSGIPDGVDPKLGVQVTANRQYYVAVSGAGNTSFNPFRQASGTAAFGTGTYKLKANFVAQNIAVSDPPITVFRPVNRTRFSSARLGYDASGTKVSGNDIDTFIYTPAGNGAVSISVLPSAESAAAPSFRFFSQTGTNPYVPVNQTVGTPGSVIINVTAGTKYAIVTSGSRSAITTNDGVSFQSTGATRGTTGAYTVSIDDSKLTTAPPVLNGPASRSFTISSNSTLQGFTIADPDAGSTVSTLTASVDRGTLTGGGKSGAGITITGTLTQLNASLAQLAFKSANFDASSAKLTITAKDASGNSATLSSTLVPTQNLITTITDPQLAGKKSVLVVGTSTADVMSITGSGTNYRVVMNGRTVNLTGVTGRIMAFGLAGNDSIDMPSVAIATISYGGDGNDIIRAGSAADWIFGENGSDLLAGGLGIDQLNGGADSDLLFDGSVAPKSASVSLASTLSLWKTLINPTNNDYATIYNRLNISSDKNSRDTIKGTAGLDLFFASVTDILDKIASERTRFA